MSRIQKISLTSHNASYNIWPITKHRCCCCCCYHHTAWTIKWNSRMMINKHTPEFIALYYFYWCCWLLLLLLLLISEWCTIISIATHTHRHTVTAGWNHLFLSYLVLFRFREKWYNTCYNKLINYHCCHRKL